VLRLAAGQFYDSAASIREKSITKAHALVMPEI